MIVEIFSALSILSIAILFLNPTHLTMPDTIQSMLILGLIIAFLVFSAYLLKEKSSDERELIHILKAGRVSYLVGVGTLVIGLIVQATMHEVDKWLVIVLCAMVFSKLISRIYSHFHG